MIWFTVLLILLIVVSSAGDTYEVVACCVNARTMSHSSALIYAALCNFFGGLIMLPIGSGVAKTIFGVVDFGFECQNAPSAVNSALLSVLLWSVIAMSFGLPTAECHTIPAALSGAAMALGDSNIIISTEEWVSILFGLFLTTVPAFLLGYIFYSVITRFFSGAKRERVLGHFSRTQRLSMGSNALLHGAQNSQKFLGVYILGLSLWRPEAQIPSSLSYIGFGAIFSALVALGTLIGGRGIIKKVGCDLTRLDSAGGSAADSASSVILSLCSVLGIPADASYSKVCSIMGVGMCRPHGTNPRIALQMVLTWMLSLPICLCLGYVFSFFLSR